MRKSGASLESVPELIGRWAAHLGLTVETVSRSLTALRTRGLIALPGTYVVEILDPAGLKALEAA